MQQKKKKGTIHKKTVESNNDVPRTVAAGCSEIEVEFTQQMDFDGIRKTSRKRTKNECKLQRNLSND